MFGELHRRRASVHAQQSVRGQRNHPINFACRQEHSLKTRRSRSDKLQPARNGSSHFMRVAHETANLEAGGNLLPERHHRSASRNVETGRYCFTIAHINPKTLKLGTSTVLRKQCSATPTSCGLSRHRIQFHTTQSFHMADLLYDIGSFINYSPISLYPFDISYNNPIRNLQNNIIE